MLETRPNFVVSKKLAAVEPVQAGSHFLPKPGIIIEIIFDELLNVVVGGSAVFRRDAVKPRFQLRSEMYFHVFRIGKCGIKRQIPKLGISF